MRRRYGVAHRFWSGTQRLLFLRGGLVLAACLNRSYEIMDDRSGQCHKDAFWPG